MPDEAKPKPRKPRKVQRISDGVGRPIAVRADRQAAGGVGRPKRSGRQYPDPARLGRPSMVHNELLRRQICNEVAQGATYEAAALMHGLALSTLYLWRSKGLAERDRRSRGIEPDAQWDDYVSFVEGLETADAVAQGVIAQGIMDHGRNDWRALAWLWINRYGLGRDQADKGPEIASPRERLLAIIDTTEARIRDQPMTGEGG